MRNFALKNVPQNSEVIFFQTSWVFQDLQCLNMILLIMSLVYSMN